MHRLAGATLFIVGEASKPVNATTAISRADLNGTGPRVSFRSTMGQALADEIFRVIAQEHPGIEIFPIDANAEVIRMIERVKSGSTPNLPTPAT
jgi:hypothetical protein